MAIIIACISKYFILDHIFKNHVISEILGYLLVGAAAIVLWWIVDKVYTLYYKKKE
jgi:hypothetical protein